MGILKTREVTISASIAACNRLIFTFPNHLEDIFSTWTLRKDVTLRNDSAFRCMGLNWWYIVETIVGNANQPSLRGCKIDQQSFYQVKVAQGSNQVTSSILAINSVTYG